MYIYICTRTCTCIYPMYMLVYTKTALSICSVRRRWWSQVNPGETSGAGTSPFTGSTHCQSAYQEHVSSKFPVGPLVEPQARYNLGARAWALRFTNTMYCRSLDSVSTSLLLSCSHFPALNVEQLSDAIDGLSQVVGALSVQVREVTIALHFIRYMYL